MTDVVPARSKADADAILASVKRHEPEWHLTALLAPRECRDDLLIMAAFSGEVERIAHDVSEPMIGEIRVQWWRDALGLSDEGASAFVQLSVETGHPVADAMAALMARRGLDRGLVAGFLDAHAHVFHTEQPQTWDEVDQHIDESDGAIFALAASLITGQSASRLRASTSDAARAFGLMRRVRTLPTRIEKDRLPFPMQDPLVVPDWWAPVEQAARRAQAALARARAQPDLKRPFITAMLPSAVVEPYFETLQSVGTDSVTELSPLTRAWAIGKAYVRGRI